MACNSRLTPVAADRPRGDRTHSGTIIPEWPNRLWGTDATRFYTRREGWCWFFGAIDHRVADIVGWEITRVVISHNRARLEDYREFIGMLEDDLGRQGGPSS